ncbi:hypothetical protein GCM10011335_45940 [Aureimonas glaciei]|uniref:Uncharacterized protein n=1 Tax=Aureimonas glaciei TaxID=1776957 RepID=A0A916YAN5_9HYPH|nr:hypothetical protein GCM10011335_45940 [Aureimonas glaciei]
MEEPRKQVVRSDKSVSIIERIPAIRSSPRRPTPIPISGALRNLIVLAIVAVLVLILWAVPVVLVVALGGFSVAMVLSFPVRLFSRVMPRSLAMRRDR